jgi:membrane-associated phospholipid phosphatase
MIDISISSLFFYHNTFPLRADKNILIKVIDHLIEFGGITLWVGVVGYFWIKELKANGLKNFWTIGVKRKLIYIALVGLIGSVTMVRAIKWYIMRCRPMLIDIFGGPAEFTEVWTRNSAFYTSKCVSFVSGHSAIGFLLFSLAFLYPKSDLRRKKYILLKILIKHILMNLKM